MGLICNKKTKNIIKWPKYVDLVFYKVKIFLQPRERKY